MDALLETLAAEPIYGVLAAVVLLFLGISLLKKLMWLAALAALLCVAYGVFLGCCEPGEPVSDTSAQGTKTALAQDIDRAAASVRQTAQNAKRDALKATKKLRKAEATFRDLGHTLEALPGKTRKTILSVEDHALDLADTWVKAARVVGRAAREASSDVGDVFEGRSHPTGLPLDEPQH